MQTINEFLFIGATLLFSALLLSAVSLRAGVPTLLVFLAVGLLATEIPGAPAHPINTHVAALTGSLALAVILLDGGLRTRVGTIRLVVGPALALATAGVLLTAALVGVAAVLLLGFDWRYGLLLGAIVGSTDAAAVFALLRSGGRRMNERVEATIEVESGANDPMAVFLTIACIELIRRPELPAVELLGMFALQLGLGLAFGLLLGRALGAIVARVRFGEGLLALLIHAGGLVIFALTSLAQGSGFLAIYVAGIVIARDRARVNEDVLRAGDGLAWLAQAGMFLILGVVTDVSALLEGAPQALLIAVGLMFVARPLAVAACLLPFGYPRNEIIFIGWMGLRGAVPIVLGLFVLLAGIDGADLLFHVAFFTVLLSLILQGGSLQIAARWAGVGVHRISPVLSSASMDRGESQRELVQLRVLPGAAIVAREREDLQWPHGARIVDILRDGTSVPEALLQAGDIAAFITPARAIDELEEMFAPAAPAGEWQLAGSVILQDLADFYGVTLPADATAGESVAAFLERRMRGRPAIGDRVTVGTLLLTVRRASEGKVRRVSLRLLPQPDTLDGADAL